MRDSDWSLVYCNQWKWGSVAPLAEAVDWGTVNNFKSSETDR